jgi:hypothetical protein
MSEIVIHQTTPEETARLEALAAEWDREKDSVIAELERKEAAAMGNSLAAQVRQAIFESFLLPDVIAKDIGVETDLVHRFQLAEEDLPFSAFEKLVKRLGLKLVRETPVPETPAVPVCEQVPVTAG